MPLDPDYYSSLAPFRETFTRGRPILTWHKLGPRPSGVRLKGLYVSAALFRRQLAELRQAGFETVAPGQPLAREGNPRREIVFTFDDGYVNVLRHGLAALAEHRFHAIQFLVTDRLGQTNDWDVAAGEKPEPLMDVVQVRDWLAAGHEIGAHTLTHPLLTHLPREQAREEIGACKRKLEDMFGRAVEHFCYPYGDWSPAVRDCVAEAGFRTACTTEGGINTPATPPFALKRFTARYPTRRLRAFRDRFAAWWRDGRRRTDAGSAPARRATG